MAFMPLERQKLHIYKVCVFFYNHLNIFLNDYGVKKKLECETDICVLFMLISIQYIPCLMGVDDLEGHCD